MRKLAGEKCLYVSVYYSKSAKSLWLIGFHELRTKGRGVSGRRTIRIAL
jgi:hypothetical protein